MLSMEENGRPSPLCSDACIDGFGASLEKNQLDLRRLAPLRSFRSPCWQPSALSFRPGLYHKVLYLIHGPVLGLLQLRVHPVHRHRTSHFPPQPRITNSRHPPTSAHRPRPPASTLATPHLPAVAGSLHFDGPASAPCTATAHSGLSLPLRHTNTFDIFCPSSAPPAPLISYFPFAPSPKPSPSVLPPRRRHRSRRPLGPPSL